MRIRSFREELSFKKKIYRRVLYALAIIDLIVLAKLSQVYMAKMIPDNIYLVRGQTDKIDFGISVMADFNEQCIGKISVDNKTIYDDSKKIALREDFLLGASKNGTYSADISLFGIIKLKNINLDVIDNMYVTPGGNQIGIYIETDGLLVLDNGDINGADGMEYSPAVNIIKKGDYIISVEGKTVRYKKELIDVIQSAKSDSINMVIRRNDEDIDVCVKRIMCEDNLYRIGLWVRDNMQGIGTLTYYDEDFYFGALGHGINDIDTGLLMELDTGNIFETKIIDIKKGKEGEPGELVGIINNTEQSMLGKLNANTPFGIFGQINKNNIDLLDSEDKIKVALKQEVQEGKAIIRCQLDGDLSEYEVNICDISLTKESNRNFVVEVIDEELLNKTNGIIQGMSGSPIIQNGKFIGAVTHVFVNDPTKGYGIFAETMLEQE